MNKPIILEDIDAINNKIGDFNANGISESSVAEAIKNVKTSISSNASDIGNIEDIFSNVIHEKFTYSANTIDSTISFKTINTTRKILDEDFIPIQEVLFIANLLEAIPSTASTEGGTNYLQKVVISEGSSSTSCGGGTLNFIASTTSMDEKFCLLRQGLPCPHFFVIAEIQGSSHASGTNKAEIALYKDANNRIQIAANLNTNNIELYTNINSSANSVNVYQALASKFQLGLLFANGSIIVFYKDDNTTWKYISSYTISTINFASLDELKKWHIGLAAYFLNNSSGAVYFRKLRVMLTPGLGYRSHTMLTYEDGSPIIKDGKLFFAVNLGGVDIKSSGLGIISYDYKSYDTHLVSLLYRLVTSTTSYAYADGQCDIFYDRRTLLWNINFSSVVSQAFGITSKIQIYNSTTKSNILKGINFLSSSLLNIPGTGSINIYDTFTIYDYSVSKWRMIYTAGFGTIRMIESSDYSTWTTVAESTNGKEGAKICRLGGNYVVTAPYERTVAFFNYPNLTNRTLINLDIQSGHRNPHMMLFPLPEDLTKYQIITMDGARLAGFDYSWGANWIYEGDLTKTGYDYDYNLIV